jgi:predicted ester cyclase
VKKYFKNPTLSEKGNSIFKKILEAFPDIHAKIEHIISKNDQVVVFINFNGTHKGHFKGINPTNKQVEIRSADLYKLENEKIVDHWDVVDESDLLARE